MALGCLERPIFPLLGCNGLSCPLRPQRARPQAGAGRKAQARCWEGSEPRAREVAECAGHHTTSRDPQGAASSGATSRPGLPGTVPAGTLNVHILGEQGGRLRILSAPVQGHSVPSARPLPTPGLPAHLQHVPLVWWLPFHMISGHLSAPLTWDLTCFLLNL